MNRILLIGVFIFLMGNVFAVEGVSPGSYEVDFEAGLERKFVFDFVLDDVRELEIEGDLAEYVELDRYEILKGRVIATLRLPERVDGFGVSDIRILAGDVVGIIKVKIPYPEKYLEVDLSIPDVNVGKDVPVNLRVFNFGKENLNISPVIEVYSGDGVVETFEGEDRLIGGLDESVYEFSFSSLNYSGGEYVASAKVGEFSSEDVFRLGEFEIKILNYTREVRSGVARFDIEVESLWNDKMNEVYAEVRVIGHKGEEGEVLLDRVNGFDSSIVSLNGWEKKRLVGYFDTADIEGEVMMSIDVHYDGKIESEVVRVYIEKGFFLFFWIAGVLFCLGLGWWFFIRKRR